MTKKEEKYNLVPLTDEELIEANLNKDKVEFDLMNAKGKLEIQQFKVKNDIAQIELKEDLEKIEDAISEIGKTKKKLKEDDKDYKSKSLRMDYDILCGNKRLELAHLKIEKRMGSRISNEAIRTLVDQIELCKNNLKYFSDQVRNKVRKERITEEQIQLDGKEGSEDKKE